MFWYLPLPMYKERWTELTSGSNGIVETFLKKHNIPYYALRPLEKLYTIKNGVVVDTEVMTYWHFWQVKHLVDSIMQDLVKEGDTIYFEDFWTPGMEMVPYALSLKGLMGKVKLTAFNHAQSVDKNDFTAKKMLPWIRGFEIAWAHCLDKIYTASEDLAELTRDEFNLSYEKVEAIGTIFDSAKVWEMFSPETVWANKITRDRTVVYSSRFDEEKDPMYFLDIAEAAMKLDANVKFVVCTGASKLKGYQPAIDRLKQLQLTFHHRIVLAENCDKAQYYAYLYTSAVQFNTAKQDFVSYTLLEATTLGCVPFYPENNTSFAGALGMSEFLLYYKRMTQSDVVIQLLKLCDYSMERKIGVEPKNQFKWVYQKYEDSLARMFGIDLLTLEAAVNLSEDYAFHWDTKFIEWEESWQASWETGGLVKK